MKTMRPLKHNDPPGTDVFATMDDGVVIRTKTRSKTWQAGSELLVSLEGLGGAYPVERCQAIEPSGQQNSEDFPITRMFCPIYTAGGFIDTQRTLQALMNSPDRHRELLATLLACWEDAYSQGWSDGVKGVCPNDRPNPYREVK